MTTKIPLEEMKGDLSATNRDIARLISIVRHLDAFIEDSHGEDRSLFRIDLMRFRSMLSEGLELKKTIEKVLESAVQNEV